MASSARTPWKLAKRTSEDVTSRVGGYPLHRRRIHPHHHRPPLPHLPYATAKVWASSASATSKKPPERRTEEPPMGRPETRHQARPARPHLPPSRQRTRPDHDRHGRHQRSRTSQPEVQQPRPERRSSPQPPPAPPSTIPANSLDPAARAPLARRARRHPYRRRQCRDHTTDGPTPSAHRSPGLGLFAAEPAAAAPATPTPRRSPSTTS